MADVEIGKELIGDIVGGWAATEKTVEHRTSKRSIFIVRIEHKKGRN